jgi:uncharacterized membrane protein YkoI
MASITKAKATPMKQRRMKPARTLLLGLSLSATLLATLAAVPAAAQRLSREVSEQETAKDRRQSGELRPLDELLQRAQASGKGEYLGVDFDADSNQYRFKFMRPNGAVVAVDVDGRTGRVLKTQ